MAGTSIDSIVSARRRTNFGLLSYPLDGPLLFAINGCIIVHWVGIGVLWVVVLVRLSRVPFDLEIGLEKI